MRKKTEARVDVLTRATIAILERANGSGIPGPDLFPRALSRAALMVDEENDDAYEDAEVVAPDESFRHRHWKDVKILAAGTYKAYIIPYQDGFRLGTAQEYADITEKVDKPIADGIVRSGRRRARILRARGLEAPVLEEPKLTPLLEAGDEQ